MSAKQSSSPISTSPEGAAKTAGQGHSTTAKGAWSTSRIAVDALFVALAIALSFVEFPIFPAAPYLKYDPSGIVALVAGFAFGPGSAAIVAVLAFVPHLFTNWVGAIMAMVVGLSATLPAAFIYKKDRTFRGALIGLVTGAVVSVAMAILWNLFMTPLYTPGVAVSDVVGLIVPVLLPFNALKAVLNAAVTLAVYKPISTLVKKTAA